MVEIKTRKVPQHTSHDHWTVAPFSEVELELVVLHILVALDVTGIDPTSSQMLGNRLSDGRLLRHAEDLLWHLSCCL